MKKNDPGPACPQSRIKGPSHVLSALRAFVAIRGDENRDDTPARHVEDALEACIAVLAVFTWLAAMILLP